MAPVVLGLKAIRGVPIDSGINGVHISETACVRQTVSTGSDDLGERLDATNTTRHTRLQTRVQV